MKQSYVIGIVMLWVMALWLCCVAENNNIIGNEQTNLISVLLTPQGTDFSNPITAVTSIITDVWQYMKVFLQMAVLWFPDLWHGNWIWVWYVICLPLAIGMIFSIVTILRGVHNS
jgi:hypothetical protein